MDIYDDFLQRGLIAQVTNEKKVKDLLNNHKIKFYIGFEPTASSLHVGHFVQILIMSRLQQAGHTPIILFGGGTGMIGDPSGKTDMRRMLTTEEINHNISCFKSQASRFLDFSKNKAIMLNNAEWLCNLNYISFLREIGVHFSVNRMLSFECYKQRLEKGLSFFELNYMLMQSYDFLYLNRKYGCDLQLGGDDQWSNIIGGVELIRKVDRKESYGLTFVLLTTHDGKKMGKTEKGALWLDPNMTSPYDFYQYWRNVDDNDVIKCLKILTFLPIEEINSYEALNGKDINKVKDILAFEITKLVHGEEEAIKSRNTSKSIFSSSIVTDDIPTCFLTESDLNENKINIIDLLIRMELSSSKGDARRLIIQGGVSLDNKKIESINFEIDKITLQNGCIIKKGKKVYKRAIL